MELDLLHESGAAHAALDADEKAKVAELNGLRSLPSKKLRQQAVSRMMARKPKARYVIEEKTQNLIALEQARDDNLAWDEKSAHSKQSRKSGGGSLADQLKSSLDDDDVDDAHTIAKATIEGQAAAKLAIIDAASSVNVKLFKVEEAAMKKSTAELRTELADLGVELTEHKHEEEHHVITALLLNAHQTKMDAEKEKRDARKLALKKERDLIKNMGLTAAKKAAKEVAAREAAIEEAARVNNELLAVESLISRLARGETADGTPASYDDMLASKLEALSTSVDAGAKARRLGKQSSFERLRALRVRRAASEEQVPTASPMAPTKRPVPPRIAR
jgi:hypothetical protein